MEKVSKQSTFLLQTESQCLFLIKFFKLSLEVQFDCAGWLKASSAKFTSFQVTGHRWPS